MSNRRNETTNYLDSLRDYVDDYEEYRRREKDYIDDNPDSERLKLILSISTKEKLNVSEDKSGIELNEGYSYELNGAIPEIADGIAKMAIELDKMSDMGDNGGQYFLSLIAEYYNRLKGGE